MMRLSRGSGRDRGSGKDRGTGRARGKGKGRSRGRDTEEPLAPRPPGGPHMRQRDTCYEGDRL